MASIAKRENSYRISVSNGRDVKGKQIIETTTFTPDPNRTEKQNKKALEIFALEFEQKVKSGKYLDSEKITFQVFSDTWLRDYAEQHLELTTIDIYKKLLHLALFCGLRRGELIALTWSDFDFSNHTVSITQSTSLAEGKAITKAPKNKSSIRMVTVPDSVIQLLKVYQKEQYRLRLSLGTYWKGEGHIFIKTDGGQMYPSTPYSVFKGVIHRYNQEAAETFDDLFKPAKSQNF